MCHQDIAIGDSPAETDPQTNGVARQGQGALVVDEEVEGIVDEGRLDRLDGVRDVARCD